jgi:hypothetical protein
MSEETAVSVSLFDLSVEGQVVTLGISTDYYNDEFAYIRLNKGNVEHLIKELTRLNDDL